MSKTSSWNLKKLTLAALPVLSAFWLAVGVGVIAAISPGYSHVSHFMSVLGATGSPFANWVNYAVFIVAELWLLLFLAMLAVHLPHSKSKWFSMAGLSSYVILLIFAAIFPCDAGCNGESDNNAPVTSVHKIHMVIAAIAYPIALISMLPLSLAAPSNTCLRRLAWPVVTIGSCLIFAIVFVPHAQGLFQRLIEALIYAQLILMGWYASSLPISAEQ